MVYPIHSQSVLRLVFCFVNENSLNYTSGLVLLCFFVSSSDALFCFTFVHTAITAAATAAATTAATTTAATTAAATTAAAATKLKKSIFLNNFFLQLMACVRMTSFSLSLSLSLCLAKVLRSFT